MIKGIDVSNNNDPIDMNLFAKEGNKFVVCKATQGTWFIDKYFQNYVRAARSAGMKVGAYHYAEYNNITNALIEANLFLTTAMQEKVDFLALDIESDKQIGDLTVATNAFMQVIHSAGVPILIYSYPEFIKAHFDTSIQQYDLWISNMNVSYPDIYCWNEYKMWQYTIENDIDRNYMTEEFYNKLLEVEQMDKLVIVHGDGDIASGILAMQFYQCPMVMEQDYINNKIQAKTPIFIGGKEPDRFKTARYLAENF